MSIACRFLASGWPILRICRQTLIEYSSNLMGELIANLPGLSNFCVQTRSNCPHSWAFEKGKSFRAFAHKPGIGLSSNMVGELAVSLNCHHFFLSCDIWGYFSLVLSHRYHLLYHYIYTRCSTLSNDANQFICIIVDMDHYRPVCKTCNRGDLD